MIPLTSMLSAPFCIHFQHCKLTVLHCTHLRNGIQLPWNDSSVQSICSNTKPYSVHPGLRWRYVRQGLYGGKVGSILCSDWPSAQRRWSDLAFSALLTLFLRGKKIFLHIIMWYNFILSFFDQACFVNILASFIFFTNIQLPCTLTPHLINRINIKEAIPMCLLILIKPQVAVHESASPVQENSHGGNQENWEEGIPMGALLWLGSHRDRWAGAYAQNGQNTVQVCPSAAQNGVSHPHPTHNKVCYTRSDERHWVRKAMFILYWIVFALPWKADRIGLLFTHRNGCGGIISVTEQSCALPISKVE